MPKQLAVSVYALLLLSGCIGISPGAFPTPREPTPTSISGTELPFEVVLRAESSAYLGAMPALYLVTSPDDAQVVANTLKSGYPEEFLKRVQQLEDRQILLALFREPQGSGGYQIRVHRILLQGDELYVYTELCDPKGRGGIAAETAYFQIVQVTLPPEAHPAADLKPVLVAYDVNC